MVGDKSISCIILSCLNDLFVKERLIPSIKKTTKHLKDWDVEIIVVDSGPTQDFKMEDVKVIKKKMEDCVEFLVPMKVDVAIGDNFGETI